MEDSKTTIGSAGTLNSNNVVIEEKVQKLQKEDSELIHLTDHVIKRGIGQLEKEGAFSYFKSALPSFIVLLLSFIVDVAYVPLFGHVANSFSQYLFPGSPPVNVTLEPVSLWWMPILAYLVFILFALRSNKTFKDEILSKGASENIITRVESKYGGLVDGIGTALPLIGAAILLVSIKIGPQLFLGFSVPFEIKSIIILAIAKLFSSVFEAQGLRYAKIVEEVKNVETEYYYDNRGKMQDDLIYKLSNANREVLTEIVMSSGAGLKHFSKEEIEYIYKLIKISNEITKEFAMNISSFKNTVDDLKNVKLFDERLVGQFNEISATISNVAGIVQKSAEYSMILKQQLDAIHKLGEEINKLTINMPDEKALKELQMTAHFLSETVTNIKDPGATKSLDNLAFIIGRR